MGSRWNGGGCRCCGPVACGQLCVTVTSCTGSYVSGATVTVTQGGVTIGTGTTDAGGDACIPIPAAGTYTVTYAKTGFTTVTQTLSLVCATNTISVNLVTTGTKICIVVDGCGAHLPGVTVTVSQGGTTVGTCTTDASGFCCVAVPSTGSYTVTTAKTGFVTGTQTVTAACGTNNTTKTLTIATGYSCSPEACCSVGEDVPYPIHTWPTTIFVNDGLGTITCTGALVGGWTGCATRSATGVTVCPVSGSPTIGSITVGIQATVTCTSGTWAVQFDLKCGCGFYTPGSGPGSLFGYPTPGDCSSPEYADANHFVSGTVTPTVCPPSLALSGNISNGSCTGAVPSPIQSVYGCGGTFPVTVSQ